MTENDVQTADSLQETIGRIETELSKTIVGQKDVVRELLIAIFIRGHCLLEGVPGLGKTLMVRSLAGCLSLEFRRIQFTPDLMPSDITGTEILEPDPRGGLVHKTVRGPVFCNLLLADEINRTPPKTQAALLEAMSERQVTIGSTTHGLPDPFFVLATQNPLEQEGTYPLPEAQLDRFVFKVRVDYPSVVEEVEIMRSSIERSDAKSELIVDGERIREFQQLIAKVPVPDAVYRYAARLVRATRPGNEEAISGLTDACIEWGAGPRASIFMIAAAQANALFEGRYHAGPEDVRAVAPPILRHRLGIKFAAPADGRTADSIVADLLGRVPEA